MLVALAATVYLTIGRTPFQEQRDHVELNDTAIVETRSVLADTAKVAGSGSSRVEVATTELRDMSQTFRNSTFLIAIRRSGFQCAEVVAAQENTEGVWLASCMDKLAYTLGVHDVDQFDVRPVGQYLDSLPPSLPLRNDQLPDPRLEQEPFRQ